MWRAQKVSIEKKLKDSCLWGRKSIRSRRTLVNKWKVLFFAQWKQIILRPQAQAWKGELRTQNSAGEIGVASK